MWIASGAALSTRYHLVFSYETLATVPASLEVLAVSTGMFLVLGLAGLAFPLSVYYLRQDEDWRLGLACGFTSSLPLGLLISRCFFESIPSPGIWEVVWFSVWTGLAMGSLCRVHNWSLGMPSLVWQSVLVVAMVSAFGWWLLQSHWYYQAFRLGFNDFGHFTQRIANTAAGRGFLLETPVLPIFWDHFNPGLALLVPLWWLCPNVYWVFFLQALSLASPALVLASIVRKLGGGPGPATLWGMAWLLYPSIGQMNIAYTYGWHPITVAIPLLLLAYRLMLSSRFLLSAMSTILACAFEEGVIVVVGCFAAAMFLRSLAVSKQAIETKQLGMPNGYLNARSWFALFLVAIISFGFVYSMSGLATFQTGRFARLGGSASEIVLSPFLKPSEFWGLLFRARNADFLSLFFAPFLAAGVFRGRWHLLAIGMPLGVLLVWEHLPAQCIAFQYTACLIPVLFLGCVESAHRVGEQLSCKKWNWPAACVTTGWVLSLFVGQLPWSQNSLIDVIAATYDDPIAEPRQVGSEDNRWLSDQIARVVRSRVQIAPIVLSVSPRVLATGRIAAHCVGLPDVETVGQFWQRERDLANLDPLLSSPLLRYDVLLLDFRERFQQTESETIRVRDEALKLGFRISEDRFGILVMVRAAGR